MCMYCKVYRLFRHNSSVLEVTYYAQNYAGIMWKSLLATAIFSRPPSLAWHSKLLIHHSYNGEQSVLFARSNLPYSFSMQLRSIAASLGDTPVTQFRGRAASQFTVVVSRAGRPFTVKERQLVRNAICSCL